MGAVAGGEEAMLETRGGLLLDRMNDSDPNRKFGWYLQGFYTWRTIISCSEVSKRIDFIGAT